MKSIRTQLVLWLVGGALVLTTVAATGLYGYMEEVLDRGLDAALAAKAEAIAGAVHMEDDGRPHLQTAETTSWANAHHEGPFYFQIWQQDGSTLARVVPQPQAQIPLPRITRSRKRFVDAKLADGTWVRVTELSFIAQADEDQFDSRRSTTQPTRAHLVLVVVHDRRSIDGPLAILLSGLLLAAILVGVGILLIVTWGVRRGLGPLAQVSALADTIGPESLHIRFPGPGQLPLELVPIGLKLNELLDRLSDAFARERRFSAAVAHELRTPLAELRSACDVALRWPEDSEGLSTALHEARDVSMQMSTMVHTLLALARQQAGAESSTSMHEVSLSAAVAGAWPGFASAALSRQQIVDREINDAAVVQTDPTLLTAILRNLLENAVDYTPAGGRIVISTSLNTNQSWSLRVTNTCTDLKPSNVPQMFEPFWRADPARTGTNHAGLGLTLVQAYCKTINVSVTAALFPDHLELTLQFPITSASAVALV